MTKTAFIPLFEKLTRITDDAKSSFDSILTTIPQSSVSNKLTSDMSEYFPTICIFKVYFAEDFYFTVIEHRLVNEVTLSEFREIL